METEGVLAPATADEARRTYEALVRAARAVVSEAGRAMDFDRDELRERVTPEVVATAHEALFASLLTVRVGTRDEFDAWVAEHPDLEVVELGSENVDHVVWHAVPFAGTAVAATYQNEREAAVETLRRQAFGRLYREVVVDG